MVDPAIFIFVGVVMAAAAFGVYYMFKNGGEDNFEKIYNTEALAILADVDNKNKKKKENKKEKKDKKKQDKEQKEPKDDEEELNEKENEHPKQEKAETKQQKKASVETVAPLKVNNQQQKNGNGNAIVEEVVEKKLESPKEPQAPKKNKSPKPVNVKDLDSRKVLARLANVTDLEEGYMQFLSNAFRDAENQKNNLTAEVKAMQRKLGEQAQKTEKLQKEKAAILEKEKAEQAKLSTLNAQIKTFQTREANLLQSAQAAQASVHQHEDSHAKELQHFRQKLQHAESEVHSLRGQNSKLNHSIKNLQSQMAVTQQMHGAAEQQANAYRQQLNSMPPPVDTTEYDEKIAILTEKVRGFDVIFQDMEAKMEKKANDYVSISKDAAAMEKDIEALEASLAYEQSNLKAQSALVAEKDAAIKKLEAENARLTKELATTTKNHNELKNIVDDLNKIIAEKITMEGSYLESTKRVEDLVKQLADQKSDFDTKEAKHKEQLAQEHQKVAQLEKTLEVEKSRVVEIPLNAAPAPVVEEVFELKKTNTDLAAAPSTSGPSEKEIELEAAREKLQIKNDELRQRNYALLEKTEDAPKRLLEDRRRVVAAVGKLGKKQLKNVENDDEFHAFVEKTVEGAEQQIAQAQAQATSSKAAPAPAKAAAPAAAPTNSTNSDDGFYRQTVVDLANQLEVISKLQQKSEAAWEAKLAAAVRV